MFRAIVGLIKGLIVGGGVGYGLLKLGADNSVIAYLACALVGALVGVVCGRAPWRSDTVWTPVVKAIFGGIVGVGLCAVGMKLLPEVTLLAQSPVGPFGTHSGAFLATAVGVLYGTFVEIDDGGKPDEKSESAAVARKKQA